MKKTICLILALLVCFSLMPLCYAFADKIAFSDDPKAIQVASNSVIMLSCYDKDGNLYATGSAFAAFEEGIFVTNCHVIEKEIYSIKAQMESGLEFTISSVVTYNADKDIAILCTEARTGLDPLPIGRTDALERGEKVIAIGSPLGLINTLSIGLYSGTIKDEQVYLQFSAPISHGSSGGALFNNRGEVVGITSASFTEGQNLNLAIPIEEAVNLWKKRTEVKELSVPEFYDEWDHFPFFSVSYILSHESEFSMSNNITILTAGYVVEDPANSDTATSGGYYLVESVADFNAINGAINNLNASGGLLTTGERSSDAIKDKRYEIRKNLQVSLYKLLDKTALKVISDSSKVAHGDYIRIQADVYTSFLRNPVIVD